MFKNFYVGMIFYQICQNFQTFVFQSFLSGYSENETLKSTVRQARDKLISPRN